MKGKWKEVKWNKRVGWENKGESEIRGLKEDKQSPLLAGRFQNMALVIPSSSLGTEYSVRYLHT